MTSSRQMIHLQDVPSKRLLLPALAFLMSCAMGPPIRPTKKPGETAVKKPEAQEKKEEGTTRCLRRIARRCRPDLSREGFIEELVHAPSTDHEEQRSDIWRRAKKRQSVHL